MKILLRELGVFCFLIMLMGVAACSQGVDASYADDKAKTISKNEVPAEKVESEASKVDFEVYKSPTCGCCAKWIDHLHENGYKTSIHHPENLNALKARYGIAVENQSCHTAVSPDGHLFEGHVPAKFIKRFKNEISAGGLGNAIGLSVPAMPRGTPGMEVPGDKFDPYELILLKKDGSSEVYADIKTAAEQY